MTMAVPAWREPSRIASGPCSTPMTPHAPGCSPVLIVVLLRPHVPAYSTALSPGAARWGHHGLDVLVEDARFPSAGALRAGIARRRAAMPEHAVRTRRASRRTRQRIIVAMIS